METIYQNTKLSVQSLTLYDAVVYHLFRNVGSLACLTQITVPTFSDNRFVLIHFLFLAQRYCTL